MRASRGNRRLDSTGQAMAGDAKSKRAFLTLGEGGTDGKMGLLGEIWDCLKETQTTEPDLGLERF